MSNRKLTERQVNILIQGEKLGYASRDEEVAAKDAEIAALKAEVERLTPKPSRCLGYPECDGALPGEPHEVSCPEYNNN